MSNNNLQNRSSSDRGQRSLGTVLVGKQWITSRELAEAEVRVQDQGGRLETSLLEMGLITEDLVLTALSEVYDVPKATPVDLLDVPSDVTQLLAPEAAVKYQAVPFRASTGRVDLALADVADLAIHDELAFLLARSIKIHVTTEARIHQALRRYYGKNCPVRLCSLVADLDRRVRQQQILASAPGKSIESLMDPPEHQAPGPGPEGPSQPGDNSPAQDESAVFLSRDHAAQELESAHTAEEIGYILMAALADDLSRVVMFQVTKGRVRGWMGSAPELRPNALREVSIGFDEPSIFLNLRESGKFFLGVLPRMPAHERMAESWGGLLEGPSLVVPIRVGSKPVAYAYGDRGGEPLDGIDLDFIQDLCQRAGTGFEKRILTRKLHSR